MERLDGVIQHYAWGDRATIAGLQGRPTPAEPEAELWLGAHAAAPARLATSDRSLAEVVAAEPASVLGPLVEERFGGQFPFLLKVLAAAQPLSIQAHPDASRARLGFARAEAAGIPLDDPTRTYRDPNHKPELICALTPFEALCGFRPRAETATLIGALAAHEPDVLLAELARRLDPPTSDGHLDGVADVDGEIIHRALAWLLRLPPSDARVLVAATIQAAASARGRGEGGDDGLLAPFAADLWWAERLDGLYPGDIGVVVALLLNRLTLAPGQALYLGANRLHAYLRGAGVELMANSDNVIRGGLTPKHIDVEELLALVDTRPGRPEVQQPGPGVHRFDTPVDDFALTRVGEGCSPWFDLAGPEIVLITDGTATITVAAGQTCSLTRGDAVLVPWSDRRYQVVPGPGSLLWRASTGAPPPPR